MKITCVSDLHGHYPDLPGGDLLIVAGDITARDSRVEWVSFNYWFKKQKYEKKVLIAGNHDRFLEKCIASSEADFMGVVEDPWYDYLCDSGTEFKGFKIWGSPWTPTFSSWAFMKDRGAPIKEKWDLIPDNIDILVTHGPPYGILDKNDEGEHCGCEELLKRLNTVKPKLHVFGHIHESYGIEIKDTKFLNASHMNEYYLPVNEPIQIDLSTENDLP